MLLCQYIIIRKTVVIIAAVIQLSYSVLLYWNWLSRHNAIAFFLDQKLHVNQWDFYAVDSRYLDLAYLE